jgi:hypothetical protein
MPEDDGKQHDAPEDVYGIVVPSAPAMVSEAFEELGIGHGREEGAEGGEGGIVFQAIPGEERLGNGDLHKEVSREE